MLVHYVTGVSLLYYYNNYSNAHSHAGMLSTLSYDTHNIILYLIYIHSPTHLYI